MKKFAKIALTSLVVSTILSSCSTRQVELAPNVTQSPENTISKQEIVSFASEASKMMVIEQDANKDDKVTLQEASITKPEMAKLDKNADGGVSKEEIAQNIEEEVNSALKVSQSLDAGTSQSPVNIWDNQYDGNIPAKPPTISTPKANKVQLFIDREEILPMMFEVIRGAKKTIQLDLYLLGGNIGLQVAQELVKKASEGVEIKIIFDPNLGFSGPTQKEVYTVVDFLRKNRVDFRLYPLHLMPKEQDGILKNKFQIDHNKITVVDESTFIIGGFNLFDVGVINRDLMLKIEGPTAKEASDMVTYEWLLSDKFVEKKPPKNVFVVKANDPAQDANVRILRTAPFESTTKQALINIIDGASKNVYLSVLEYSDQDLTNALIRASRRGVDVKVLMDRKNTNDKYAGGLPVPEYFPNILPARDLVKNKVPTRWYDPRVPGQELHMKMCVVDETHLIAGSTNFTRQAFTTFRETSVQVDAGSAPIKMARAFLDDWTGHATAIKKFTLKDKIKARVVEYLDKRYVGWW